MARHQSRVAEVVRHHYGGVQRCEIERGNGLLVEASSRLDDHGALILATVLPLSLHGDEKVVLACLTIELGGDLDLLTSCEEEDNRNACDASHLCLIEKTHKLFHQPQRQVSVLDAIDSQAPPREFVTVLQLSYDAVVNIFLLLAEEVR